MQNINLELVDEKNNLIERSQINFADVLNNLWEVKDCEKEYPWLTSVDPYGNTVFNVKQVPLVTKELEKFLLVVNDDKVKEVINQSILFLKKEEQHTYIHLIGD